MRSDYLNQNSNVSDFYIKIKKVLADTTLTADDSGSVIMVNPTATTEIDLPALSDIKSGWNCKIVLTEDTDGSDQGMGQKVNIDFGSGNDVVGLIGGIGDGDAGDQAVNNDDFIACTTNASPGDMFDIFTDGARWYVHGLVMDASECPFATAAG
tara:strand:+ start:1247 stop:1708 length:462 start_codon:yes stop_codon:yes gene_type:complete